MTDTRATPMLANNRVWVQALRLPDSGDGLCRPRTMPVLAAQTAHSFDTIRGLKVSVFALLRLQV